MSVADVLEDQIVGLRHIGYVVEDIDEALRHFRKLYGVADSAITRFPENPGEGTDTLFAFVRVADTEFELIQPITDRFRDILSKSPKAGAGLNHVAWQVRDIDACVSLLTKQGIHPGHVTPDGVVTFGGLKLVYLDPRDTGGLLVELIES